jgi:hypothetical protein
VKRSELPSLAELTQTRHESGQQALTSAQSTQELENGRGRVAVVAAVFAAVVLVDCGSGDDNGAAGSHGGDPVRLPLVRPRRRLRGVLVTGRPHVAAWTTRRRTLVLRNPLNGLDALKPAAGLAASVCVLLGSTAYDGFSSSTTWVRTIITSSIPPETLGLLGLLGFIAAAYVTYSIATWLAGILGGSSARAPPGKFAHSIIPIAVGYMTAAHYFSFFGFEGQHALILASDFPPHPRERGHGSGSVFQWDGPVSTHPGRPAVAIGLPRSLKAPVVGSPTVSPATNISIRRQVLPQR